MWHFRAFLEASRINFVLLLLLIIAEVILIHRDFGVWVMLFNTTVEIIDDWDLNLLCTIPAISRLISNILVVLLILYLVCQVIIIVRYRSTVLLAVAITLIQFITRVSSQPLSLLSGRYLALSRVA